MDDRYRPNEKEMTGLLGRKGKRKALYLHVSSKVL